MVDIGRFRNPFGLVRKSSSPLGRLFRDLWDDFDRELGEQGALSRGEFMPALDVKEDENQLTVTAELPGVKKENIDVSIHGGLLTLKGEKRQEEETKEGGYHRIERCYGNFERRVRLPDYVDEQNVAATFKDGVLTLAMPKKEEVKPKVIPIKEG